MLIVKNRVGVLKPNWVITEKGEFIFGVSPKHSHLVDGAKCYCGGNWEVREVKGLFRVLYLSGDSEEYGKPKQVHFRHVKDWTMCTEHSIDVVMYDEIFVRKRYQFITSGGSVLDIDSPTIMIGSSGTVIDYKTGKTFKM